MRKLVAVNSNGQVIGEDHHKANLSNHEVDLIRELFEDGMTYKVIAEKFEVSRSTIAMICRYERRSHTIAEFRCQRISRWKQKAEK